MNKKKPLFFHLTCKKMVIALLTFVSLSAQSAIINITTSSSNINASDSVSVYYVISDLSNLSGDSLSSFVIETRFDPTALSFDSISFSDDTLGNQLDFDAIDIDTFGYYSEVNLLDPSTIESFAVSGSLDDVLDANQAFGFRFLTLTFTALNVSTVTTVDTLFSDFVFGQNSSVVPGFNNSAVDIAISNSSVPSNPVPGPNVFWMFIASFVLLFVTKKSYLN